MMIIGSLKVFSELDHLVGTQIKKPMKKNEREKMLREKLMRQDSKLKKNGQMRNMSGKKEEKLKLQPKRHNKKYKIIRMLEKLLRIQ